MGHDEPVRSVKEPRARLGGGARPENVALLFSPDALWEIAGDVDALPGSGTSRITRLP